MLQAEVIVGHYPQLQESTYDGVHLAFCLLLPHAGTAAW